MSKKITLIVLAFFASVFLVACGKSPDVTANANGTKIGDTIKIGVNMELTGAAATAPDVAGPTIAFTLF